MGPLWFYRVYWLARYYGKKFILYIFLLYFHLSINLIIYESIKISTYQSIYVPIYLLIILYLDVQTWTNHFLFALPIDPEYLTFTYFSQIWIFINIYWYNALQHKVPCWGLLTPLSIFGKDWRVVVFCLFVYYFKSG